jgi:tetratricopeptide (TPR) repeat protein
MLSMAELEQDLPDRDRASLLAQAGDYLRTQGEPEARPLLERALSLDEAIDPNDPVVARRLSSLALLYKDVDGRPEEAQPLLERALRIDEAFYGGNHPQVASDLHGLAEVFDQLGEAETARSLDARATNILREHRVNEHERPPDPRLWDGL